ncbi:MAG: phosphohistidine phosphatase SixA [Deltaproteobacteria bacterium]|nr:phosphohistidine phosphatase SixA [Deltaproteobacteria bacterium]
MYLYLVRHGEAEGGLDDFKRRLTPRGVEDVKKIGLELKARKIYPTRIFHSPKKRAIMTAEIIASTIGTEITVEETDGLRPSNAPEIWEERLRETRSDIMLVGHMPHMPALASLLLTGDEDEALIEFRTATVLCLRKDGEEYFEEWKISP